MSIDIIVFIRYRHYPAKRSLNLYHANRQTNIIPNVRGIEVITLGTKDRVE